MSFKNPDMNVQTVCNTLIQCATKPNSLFTDNTQTEPFWKLSDLAILYPKFFDIKKPIPQTLIKDFTNEICQNIPDFRNLSKIPQHILTIRENYQIYDSKYNTMKTINGENQKLSRVACEYIFRQHENTEIEQAFFLSPGKDIDKNIDEITQLSKEIKFERIRHETRKYCDLINAIAAKSIHSPGIKPFSVIWSTLWCTLYNTDNMDSLRYNYNIPKKDSPLNHMSQTTLLFMNDVFKNIISTYCNKDKFYLTDITQEIYKKAFLARANFKTNGYTPEKQLLKTSTAKIIKNIEQKRTDFWRNYYERSL